MGIGAQLTVTADHGESWIQTVGKTAAHLNGVLDTGVIGVFLNPLPLELSSKVVRIVYIQG